MLSGDGCGPKSAIVLDLLAEISHDKKGVATVLSVGLFEKSDIVFPSVWRCFMIN